MTIHPTIGRSLDVADVAHFWKFGYVKLRNFFYDHEVADLRTAMDEALASFGKSPNGYNVTAIGDSIWGADGKIDDQGSSQHDVNALGDFMRKSGFPRLLEPEKPKKRGNFLIDTSVWRREERLAKFAREGSIPEAAATLLSVDRVRFFDDQLFVKEGGAVDKAAFHQDLSYFHLDGNRGCVVWIPLDSVRRGGGAMGYVPGSHKWGATYNANVFVSEMPSPGTTADNNMPSIDANPERYGVRYIEADPGDIVIHHFQTIHGSEGNTSDRRRRAFSLRYCDADIRYKVRPGAPFQPLHRQDARNGDSLDPEIHPIVWSAV